MLNNTLFIFKVAGDTLRSKSRYAALDETAVFGGICRHEFPQQFFNMKHGERYDSLDGNSS